jgi:hypothetical protein
LTNKTVSEGDFDFLTLTDDLDEVVTIMVEHRQWKEKMKLEAQTRPDP